MTKTKITRTEATKFSHERARFTSRLEQLLTEARAIEEALDLPSRILAQAPAVEAVGVPDEVPFEEPRGRLMRKVWEYLIDHPGLTSVELCKDLRMGKVQMATALNTLLRKNSQVIIRGRRGAFKYYAVTTQKAKK
jgi:hypothetical protein